MRLLDVVTVVTFITLTVGGASFMLTKPDAKAEQLQRAAVEGRQWMEDTTARLDSIQVGIEKITAETLELAQEVNAMADRMEEAGI